MNIYGTTELKWSRISLLPNFKNSQKVICELIKKNESSLGPCERKLPALLGQGKLNLAGKVRLDKLKLSRINKYCYNVHISGIIKVQLCHIYFLARKCSTRCEYWSWRVFHLDNFLRSDFVSIWIYFWQRRIGSVGHQEQRVLHFRKCQRVWCSFSQLSRIHKIRSFKFAMAKKVKWRWKTKQPWTNKQFS